MKSSKTFFSFSLLFVWAGLAFSQGQTKEITLEDVFKTRIFGTRSFSANSLNDGIHYTVLEKGKAIVQYSYPTGQKVDTILDLSATELESVSDHAFSRDETKILLTAQSERYYPRGQKADYYVWDKKVKSLKAVSRKGKQRLAALSPDGTKVAFVRDNNLLIKDLVSEEEYALTADGQTNEIINGATDYVYYEFDLESGFALSPDSSKIAYYKFDEREQPPVNITMFKQLYPENATYKFAKPGQKNSVVEIYVYDFKSQATQKMDVGPEKDQYLPRIKWTKDPKVLCITRMNRHQNQLELILADAESGRSQVMFKETDNSWIDIDDTLTFLDDNKRFLFSGEQDGFNHLYLYDMSGKLIRPITQGNWDVRAFLGYNPKTETVYYSASESSPLQADIYAVNINGRDKKKLTTRPGLNQATFSATFRYFINTHSDANTPPTVTVCDSRGTALRVLEDNSPVQALTKTYGFVKKEFLTFTTSDGVPLNAWMMKPPDFSADKKYPVLMYVYGGPGSQTVTDSWDDLLSWYQLFCRKGYICVSVDGRGTGFRGREFKKITYLNLGKYETRDQIEGAKYLGTLPFVDASRIGIYGGSYGGYMTALCILKGAEVFKLAVSSKPVTHWKYYDSIYTERYMRTPQENPDGYAESAPITHVDKLKGKLLLLHGTADDNVHFQHSLMLAEALVEADKQFDMHFYTNKNHNYNHDTAGNTRFHLHAKITNFILNNL